MTEITIASVAEKYDYLTSCGDMILHIAMFMPRGFYILRMMQVSKIWCAAAKDKLLWWNMMARRWPRSILKEFSPSMPTNFDPRSAWKLLKSKYCFQEYVTTVYGELYSCETSQSGLYHRCLSTGHHGCTLSNCFQFLLCGMHDDQIQLAFIPKFLYVGIIPYLAERCHSFLIDHYCEKYYGPDYIKIINKGLPDEVFDKAVTKFTQKYQKINMYTTNGPPISDLSILRACFDESNFSCTYRSIISPDMKSVNDIVERASRAFLDVEKKQVRRRDLEQDLVKYGDFGLVSWALAKSDAATLYISVGTLPKRLPRSQLPGTLYLGYYKEVLRKDRVKIYDLIGLLPSFKSQKRKIEKFIEGVGYRNYNVMEFVNMLKEDAFFKENCGEIVADVSLHPKYPVLGFNESLWESVLLKDTIETETRDSLVIKSLTDWISQNLKKGVEWLLGKAPEGLHEKINQIYNVFIQKEDDNEVILRDLPSRKRKFE